MSLLDQMKDIIGQLANLEVDERIEEINNIRAAIAEHSPFASEPVDCVQWVKSKNVSANDYNPNSVAPPEMELLRLSIASDGYTQPIVAWKEDLDKEECTVIDGFHRHRVGRECEEVQSRIHGYLPLVVVNGERTGRNDRIASTIRHNRARGKHNVEAMADIVIELKKRNWSDAKVSKELGMDPDEVLRLCQINGLTDVFGDQDFSNAWNIGIFDDDNAEHVYLTDVKGADDGA